MMWEVWDRASANRIGLFDKLDEAEEFVAEIHEDYPDDELVIGQE